MSAPLTNPDACIDALTDGIQIKVWSYITTILGDLATGDPGTAPSDVSGQVLRILTERIGIRPEAMRVALHRLRKDAWITVRKEGRGSHYRFSSDRLAETRAAATRIYAPQVTPPDSWFLTIGDPQEVLGHHPGRAIALQPNVLLHLSPVGDAPGLIRTQVDHDGLPDWVHERAIAPDWQEEYARLAALFTRINDSLLVMDPPAAQDAMTLRLLTVHHWRRLILRHPEVCEKAQARDWIGHEARRQVTALLERLPRVSPQMLQEGT